MRNLSFPKAEETSSDLWHSKFSLDRKLVGIARLETTVPASTQSSNDYLDFSKRINHVVLKMKY